MTDYSLDSLVGDVEGVVDQLGLGQFALFGSVDAGPVAISYAARHPGRIDRLILWCAWARTADLTSPRLRAWRRLLDQDWELMTETCAHLALGWSSGDAGRQAAARLREVVTREAAKAALDAIDTFDATPLLLQVETPTLVLHRRNIPWLPVEIATDLASRLRNARLALVPGESTAPYLGDVEAVLGALDEFLAAGDEALSALGGGGQAHCPRSGVAGSIAQESPGRAHSAGDRGAASHCERTNLPGDRRRVGPQRPHRRAAYRQYLREDRRPRPRGCHRLRPDSGTCHQSGHTR